MLRLGRNIDRKYNRANRSPWTRNSSCSAWQTGIADEVVTTERSHDLKFDKGTINIVYFHTHVHVHIEKMCNLSKSKIKLYICDNN